MLCKLFSLSDSAVGIIAFAVSALCFLVTFFLLYCRMDLLPVDGGRKFAVNGEKSKGKPRGAGLLFVLVFAVMSVLFLPLSWEEMLYVVFIVAAMLTGYLDDASETPWNEYKKGILDFIIAAGVTVTYIVANGTDITLALLQVEIHIPVALFAVLALVLIWTAINVVNCTDGVDGLCGSLCIVSVLSFLLSEQIAGLSGSESFPYVCIAFLACILAYLLLNCSPSILLMGDAGSRAIGLFLAVLALKSRMPLLFIPFCLVYILDGGLGLVKVSLKRFLKISILKNIRTPLHDQARKNIGWSDTQTVFRFVIIQCVLSILFLLLMKPF